MCFHFNSSYGSLKLQMLETKQALKILLHSEISVMYSSLWYWNIASSTRWHNEFHSVSITHKLLFGNFRNSHDFCNNDLTSNKQNQQWSLAYGSQGNSWILLGYGELEMMKTALLLKICKKGWLPFYSTSKTSSGQITESQSCTALHNFLYEKCCLLSFALRYYFSRCTYLQMHFSVSHWIEMKWKLLRNIVCIAQTLPVRHERRLLELKRP